MQRRRYEQKLNENDQYATQSRENENRFHYLCPFVCILFCIDLFFPPSGVTQTGDHVTGHPWRLTIQCKPRSPL